MDSARWQKVQTIFHDAVVLPPAEQTAFLRNRCGEDQELLSQVLAMLQQDAGGDSLLDRGLSQAVQKALAHDAIPTKQIGPYRIVKLLGEGGMGVVYLADRKDVGSQVAIKVLRDAWLSPARRERFAIEQQTLAKLNHPSTARLYDAATLDDGTPYFVMEYVDGVPITEYCKAKHCSMDDRLRLFRSVCEAVQDAHSHAVIHRDLKPSNILVKDDGTVRLLDFGIAKHLESLEGQIDQTVTALRLMTPAYAAPEQIRGDRVGIATDVYSLGVILYELLTSELPFDLSNLTPAEAASIIADYEPDKPSAAAARAQKNASSTAQLAGKTEWADLDVLCLAAMHKDPKRRYASVESFIRDIDHYLRREPLEARADTLGYRTRKFVQRNRSAVLTASGVFLVIVAMIVFFTVRLARERDHANRQSAIATSVNGFLADDLIGRSNPFQSGKSDETLLDAIKQASPSIDRKFSLEPQIAAGLHLTIAQALDNRSDYGDARNEYDAAHTLFLRTAGPLSQDAVLAQLQRASMEARTFQPDGVSKAKSLVAEQESLLNKLKEPRKDLVVWLDTAKGMIALVESDAKSANHYFQQAADVAAAVPGFDENARYNLRQRLAFTYIRMGDGATAERLARELIADYSKTNGPDSPYVLRVRLNLAQAFMIEKKFPESVAEANAIYPLFLTNFGPEHQLTMQLLTTRAQSEGSIGLFDDSTRDDLTIYDVSVKKQGPLSFYSIATLSDASVAQCRAGHFADGENNARKAHEAATKAFGPRSALAGGTSLPLANCLIALGKLDEASKLLKEIDARSVAQLSGDPDWGAGIALAQAEIDVRKSNYDAAKKNIEAVRPVFTRPDAEVYQKRKLETLAEMVQRH